MKTQEIKTQQITFDDVVRAFVHGAKLVEIDNIPGVLKLNILRIFTSLEVEYRSFSSANESLNKRFYKADLVKRHQELHQILTVEKSTQSELVEEYSRINVELSNAKSDLDKELRAVLESKTQVITPLLSTADIDRLAEQEGVTAKCLMAIAPFIDTSEPENKPEN